MKPKVSCCGMNNRRFINTFCLLISEIRILIRMNKIRYTINTLVPVPAFTTKNPKVVINQNRKATANEFPKKDTTFFEKPSTASLNPVYILQEIRSSPVVQTMGMFNCL